ncbi:MAG TPA: hypothetical protein VEU62_12675 [Bryobacterales bacterium]|nr:hypothetical protein [Bryobacterales bacterium]
MRQRAGLLALLASFSVYLIPLATPHATWILGAELVREVAGQGEKLAALWIATNWAVAIGMQAAAGLVFYWFFRKPGWQRLPAPLVAAPALVVVAEWLYLAAIPSHFLIESDTAPEQTGWAVECSVRDAELAAVRSPAGALEQAGEALTLRHGGSQFALLRMPGCAVIDLGSPQAASNNPFVVPGGKVLYQSMRAGPGGANWWFVNGPRAEPVALQANGFPILSSDGEWIGWTERRPAAAQLRKIGGGEEKSVALDSLGLGNYTLVDFDMRAGTLSVVRNEKEVFEVALDGTGKRVALDLGPVDPLSMTIRRTGDGYVAWDGYRDQEPYRICWSLRGGRGTHTLLRGRSINSVDADPEGRFIAVSVTTGLSIGNIRDAVYVLRAADGVAVYRKRLTTYTRSQVAFLGPRHFAYSEIESGQARVLVLRVPE